MTGIIHPSGLKQEDFPNSNGEWLVYQALSRIIMDREWVVLYDVWQERHVSQSHGQHDFIVMIPEKGIIVIEVKGSVIRIGNGGKMESLNRGRSEWVDIGSPFAQAKDNSYSLINDIDYTIKKLRKRPLVTWGVMFPEMGEWRESIEWPSYRLFINRNDDGRIGTVDLIRFLYDLTDHEFNAVNNSPANQLRFDRFSFEEYKILAGVIRPLGPEEFKVAPRPQGKDQEFEQLSIETLGGLDHLLGLNSLYFLGGAGTGKTWLCNRMIKRSLDTGSNVVVITHSELLKDWVRVNLGAKYEENALFLSANEYIKDGAIDEEFYRKMKYFAEKRGKFDVYIDEAQDVIPFFDIDKFEGIIGIDRKEIKWRLFGDPEKQAKWTDTEGSIDFFISELGLNTTSIPLRTNLRNSIKVFERLKKIIVDPVTEIEPNNILGEELYKIGYQSNEMLFEKLDSRIQSLMGQGVAMHRISVISLNEDLKKKYLASSSLSDKIADIHEMGAFIEMQKVTVAEVHEFKGLENDHILLIGLDRSMNELSKELYVAISRAKLGLSLFTPFSKLPEYMTIYS